jgi:adenine deaminase
LLLENARIVDVFSGEIVNGSVAIADGFIAGIGTYSAKRKVNLKGRFLAPGFIDAHLHIESAMTGVGEFVRTVLPHGTTAVVADPHEIANVLGPAGIDYMLQASEGQPMNLFFALPSCVPATHMETSGAQLDAPDLMPFFNHPRVVALGEVMNFPGVISEDPGVLLKIEGALERRKPIDGHCPGLGGRALQAYVAAGAGSDHECTNVQEAREKLTAGMHIMIREGSGAKNLAALLPLVTHRTAHRIMWCTDDRHPQDLIENGHIDGIIREAVRRGVDPTMAIQMGTRVAADYFGIRDVGAVAPGRKADLVVLSDLETLGVEQVYCGGQCVAEHGRMLPGVAHPKPPTAPTVMNLDPETLDFSVPAAGTRIRIIELVPEQIITRQAKDTARVIDGTVVADPRRDILKLAVVERYTGDGRTGIGFVRGFGLQSGALASSVAHDAHNIIVVGTNDTDMKAAVRAVVQRGGGLAAVSGGQVQAALALPIAGLMTDTPTSVVARRMAELDTAARQMGAAVADPFMTLSFLALPVIPALKLTDHGLVDVNLFDIVALHE